jgi:methylated-DNA-[protein]-cysteine S-methyltransferase
MNLVHKTMNSPVGRLKLVASDKGLAGVLFDGGKPIRGPLGSTSESPAHPVLVEAERQLKEYFDGKRQSFSLPLDAAGTDFQRQVWKALREIPFGETRSYGELAKEIGKPSASRAVGAANGKNPIGIVVPCHRVIGASGKLTGFAGGLDVKARLLALEKQILV